MYGVGMVSCRREQWKPFWLSQRTSSSGYHWRFKIRSSKKLSLTSNCWSGNINSAFDTRNSTTSPHRPESLPQPPSYHRRSMLGIFKFSISSASSMRRCSYPINTPTFYPRLLIFRDPCQKRTHKFCRITCNRSSENIPWACSCESFLLNKKSERALAHSPSGFPCHPTQHVLGSRSLYLYSWV